MFLCVDRNNINDYLGQYIKTPLKNIQTFFVSHNYLAVELIMQRIVILVTEETTLPEEVS